MDVKKSLLLVVDVQNGFINDETKHVVKPIKQLVTKWQQQKRGPIVYSRFINLENSPWQRLLGWTNMQSKPETDLHPDLPINGAHIFKKSTYSAWSPDINQLCQGSSIKEVVLCGIDTDQCVLETAIDIFEANLRPLLLKNYCASSRGSMFHDAAIMLIEGLIGKGQIVEDAFLSD